MYIYILRYIIYYISIWSIILINIVTCIYLYIILYICLFSPKYVGWHCNCYRRSSKSLFLWRSAKKKQQDIFKKVTSSKYEYGCNASMLEYPSIFSVFFAENHPTNSSGPSSFVSKVVGLWKIPVWKRAPNWWLRFVIQGTVETVETWGWWWSFGDLGESRGHGPWIFIIEVLGCFVWCLICLCMRRVNLCRFI